MMRAARTGLMIAAAAGAAGAVVHAAPAIASWPSLRRNLAPPLAGVGAPGHVALTFDDGPDRMATPRFLELLDRHRTRATFFMLGQQIRRNPSLAREVAAAGHEIALHGFAHRCLLARTPGATFDDLRRGRDTIADTIGTAPVWWRPPYGVLTTSALRTSRRLELRPVLWTAWGRDWTATATSESVTGTVLRALSGGGTVLLHDSDVTASPGCWRATLGAVPRILEACRQHGWSVGTLAEHAVVS